MTRLIGRRRLLVLVLGLAALVADPVRAVARELPNYSAKAGMLTVGKDAERPDAEIFHVAYTLKGANPATRPVTFVFNGGPGAASIYLHLSAIGPKTIATAGDGSFPTASARLEVNPDSWISFTDLVFIDPIGTGYSRMLPGPNGAPRDPTPYYGVESDLDVIARFIRQWLTVNNRWASPKAIAGESYGGRRVAALTKLLPERYAVNLSRAIMISPDIKVEVETTQPFSIVYPMSLLPSYAAIAAHHKLNKLGTDPAAMKAVEDYALNGYVTGLMSLGRMNAKEQSVFYTKVGSLIGIEPELIERYRGWVPPPIFASSLLANRGLMIDRYDGTQASDNPRPEDQVSQILDRSVTILSGVLLPPFMDYVRKDLGYVTNRPYIPLNLDVNKAWNRSSDLGSPDDIGIALAQNTDLKVLVVHGYHDLVTNYFLSRYVLEQSMRAKGARERLFFGTYPGGHMFYLRKGSRAEFAADVRGFFEATPKTTGRSSSTLLPSPLPISGYSHRQNFAKQPY
jgi:carboxypeptidase C (cathepsin A)